MYLAIGTCVWLVRCTRPISEFAPREKRRGKKFWHYTKSLQNHTYTPTYLLIKTKQKEGRARDRTGIARIRIWSDEPLHYTTGDVSQRKL